MNDLTERGREVVDAILRELGEEPTDDNRDALVGNHSAALFNEAAAGNVQAIIELRTQCGLPIFR